MTEEKDIREALVTAAKKRGTQSEIANAFGVSHATVGRWIEGEKISPPMLLLLRLYLFGELPVWTVRSEELSSALEFTLEEWQIIEILSRREGQTPPQWIRSQILAYLNHNPRAKVAKDDVSE